MVKIIIVKDGDGLRSCFRLDVENMRNEDIDLINDLSKIVDRYEKESMDLC